MPTPLGFGAPVVIPPVPPVVPRQRYIRVIEAGFGTPPPGDPLPTVTPPGTLNLGGWTQISGRVPGGTWAGSNGVKSYSWTRTMVNKSTGEAEPGAGQITLAGDNGWLDPTNPHSPYAGYLVPGVPIRSRITNGVDFWPCDRGFVGRWPMSQGSKAGQAATIDCYGPLGWLGAAKPLYPTEIYRAILASGPSSYWPHDDKGANIVRDVVGGFDAELQGVAALSGSSLTAEGVGASVALNNQPITRVIAPIRAMPPAPFTVSLVIRIAQLFHPTSGEVPAYFYTGLVDGLGTNQSGVFMNASYAGLYDGLPHGFLGSRAAWFGGVDGTLPPGLYNLFCTYDTNGNFTSYMQDMNTFLGGFSYTVGGPFVQPSVYTRLDWGGALMVYETDNSNTAPSVEISHVAIWPRALSFGEIIEISKAAFNPRYNESTSERCGYLLDRVGWPTSLRQLAPGITRVGDIDLSGGSNVLDLVKQAVQYEDGLLAETADGKIATIGRDGNTDPARFAVGGASAPKQNPVYSTNDATVVTSATVGNPPVIYDTGVSLSNGRVANIKQVAPSTDAAWLCAQRAVQLGVAPRPGIDSVTLDPVDVPACLTLDLASLGTVTRRPLWSVANPNVLTETQSTFETGCAGWSEFLPPNGAGTSQTPPVAFHGKAMRWRTTGAAGTVTAPGPVVVPGVTVEYLPCKPGDTVSLTASLYTTDPGTVALIIQFFTAGSVFISQIIANYPAGVGWRPGVLSGLAPPGAAFYLVFPCYATVPANPTDYYLDDIVAHSTTAWSDAAASGTGQPVDLVESQQVIGVTTTGGAGVPLKRTFSLLEPKHRQWHGRCPPTWGGATASGFTAPWKARYDNLAGVEISALFRVDDWGLLGVYRTLVSHAGPAAYGGWTFVLDSTGGLPHPALTFTWFDAGGASHTVLSQPIVRTGIRYIWASVKFVAAAGQTWFKISTGNRYQMTDWGQANVGPTSMRATGNGPVEVGAINALSSQLAGDVLQAFVTGIDGTPIALFDPTADNQAGANPWTSSAGDVWSAQGAGSLVAG